MKRMLLFLMLIASTVSAQKFCDFTTATQFLMGDYVLKNDSNCAAGASTKKSTMGSIITGYSIVTGTGTQNYLPKWNNSGGTTVGNSVIYDNGTNVGIGTTSPAQIFDIAAKFQVNSTGNILKINNVTTSFPSSQGSANSLLQNNGSGTLTWSTALSPVSVSVTGTTDATSVTTGSLKTLGGLGVSKQLWVGTDLTFPTGVDHTITTEANGSGNTGALTISTGNAGSATGTPGDLTFTGGSGEDISGASIYFNGGASTVANGGTLTFEPGQGAAANGSITFGATTLPPLISLRATSIKFTTGTPGVGKVLTDDGSGTGIAVWTTPSAGSPGGSNTQVQYNNSGVFGGITGATTDGTALTLVAPVLGTPASGTLTNCTGLPISTGVSGLGTGVATTLATNLSITGGGTIGLGGFTLTVPATGTATLGTGTATRVSFWSGTNTLSSSANMTTDGSYLTVGATGLTAATDVANFTKTQNAATNFELVNSNAGTGAFAEFVASNGTGKCFFGINGTGTTGGGLFGIPHMGFFGSSNAAGQAMYATNASGALHFYTGGSAAANERVNINSSGRTFFGGSTTATALVHLAAGTASASTAPLKFTSGTNLTTAETGAMEYNGTNLFFTRTGTTRENVITTSAVNSVSPTSPNRTITVVIDGTTYYIHAKTTND